MSRFQKILSLLVLLVFLLACNFVTQPLGDAQNLAQTAQAVASSMPIQTLEAFASAIPQETVQAAAPTVEAFATTYGDVFNPQGTPLQEWKGVPVMPQATAGAEFGGNTYSFKANVAVKDVQDFYNQKLTELGWAQPFNIPLEADGGLMIFNKDQNSLAITVTSSEGSVVVLLVLTTA